MKDLNTITNDFTVTESGAAFISQRKAAKLCGVSRGAVQYFFSPANYDVKQGLDPHSLVILVQHFARKNNEQSIDFLATLAKAGAKAFIYTGAGVIVTTQQLEHDNQQLKLELVEEKKKVKTAELPMSSQINRKKVHQKREDLLQMGMCTVWSEFVEHFYYPVTDRGISNGYENTNNGKRGTIKLCQHL